MNKKITTAFEAQRQACEMLGSPLTRDVVGFCADNFAANGVIAELVRGWQGDPLNDNVPLRWSVLPIMPRCAAMALLLL